MVCEGTLNSSVLVGSSILTEEQSVQLLNLTGLGLYRNFTLLYQARRDGFRTLDFHTKCDGNLNTFVVVKDANSQNIYGGFSTLDWSYTYYNSYKYDSNGFMFSMTNKLFKMNAANTIYTSQTDGFGFGSGPQFRIANDANMNSYSFMYTVSPNLPSDLHNTNDYYYNNGRSSKIIYFKALEIEVYSVNGKLK